MKLIIPILIGLLLSVITVESKSIQREKAAGNAEQRARQLDQGPASFEADENEEDGKTMQAAGEPQEAMREAARPASLVEKMMNKRMKQLAVLEEGHPTGGLVEKKKQAAGECIGLFKPCNQGDRCCKTLLRCTGLFEPCNQGDRCCNFHTKCKKRRPYDGSYHCRP